MLGIFPLKLDKLVEFQLEKQNFPKKTQNLLGKKTLTCIGTFFLINWQPLCNWVG
jgi:hypothetical protein